MALTLVGDSVTWLVNECDMCVLMVTREAVVAVVVLVVNCSVGAGAGKEKRHGMRNIPFFPIQKQSCQQCCNDHCNNYCNHHNN